MKKQIIIGFTALILIIINFNTTIASDAIPVSKTTVTNNADFLINSWDELPFKHLKANKSWVEYVNTNYNPSPNWVTTGYDENNEKISPKCLSYSAATVADWFSLETGETLQSYSNYVKNRP